MSQHFNQDDDDVGLGGDGAFRIPDKDVYRRTITVFGTVASYFQNRLYTRAKSRDRRILQPHFTSLEKLLPPFADAARPVNGICAHFLRRGLIKPHKTQMTCAVWSADARWLAMGTVAGQLALWEGETLKVNKVQSLRAHTILEHGDNVVGAIPITAVTWNLHWNLIVTGDRDGKIVYSDETLREVKKFPHAHNGSVRGLSHSPVGLKLVSCSDDSFLHVWAAGVEYDKPEVTLAGHQNDVKAVDWHPYRGLIASGSRDSTVRLWDPKAGSCVGSLAGHKKQVNCCSWSRNGNWLASGSKDGLIKIYDIRTMKEMEVCRGHNSDVCSVSWHPHAENILLSGAYNGSLIYWMANLYQAPHTVIADAHRQSVDAIAWHPGGHLVCTVSHDGVLKFWCREPPGSQLDNEAVKEFQDSPAFQYGPLKIGTPSLVAPPLPPGSTAYVPPSSSGPGGLGGSGVGGGVGGMAPMSGGRGGGASSWQDAPRGGRGGYGSGRGGGGGGGEYRDRGGTGSSGYTAMPRGPPMEYASSASMQQRKRGREYF